MEEETKIRIEAIEYELYRLKDKVAALIDILSLGDSERFDIELKHKEGE